MNDKNLFAQLDGLIAQLLVIVGLTLVLFSPRVPQLQNLGVEAALGDQKIANARMNLDLEKFKQDNVPSDDELRETPYQELATRQKEIRDSIKRKSIELRKAYRIDELNHEAAAAIPSAGGAKFALILRWLGRLALLLGLLVLTVQSEGMRQKVLLLVLLVVLFSSLSGVHLNFGASGQLGTATPEAAAP